MLNYLYLLIMNHTLSVNGTEIIRIAWRLHFLQLFINACNGFYASSQHY